MPDFITLSCPSCGNRLHITEDIDRFACAACGNEHIVNRSGGIITLKPIVDGIKGVKRGVDKTASELAIVRLNKEIDDLEEEISYILDREGFFASFVRIPVGIALFVVGLLVSIIFAIQVSPTWGLIFTILIITLFITGHLRGKHEDDMNRADAEPLIQKLRSKQREVVTHQQIVSDNK
jgi:ribosomal protein S27E